MEPLDRTNTMEENAPGNRATSFEQEQGNESDKRPGWSALCYWNFKQNLLNIEYTKLDIL